MNFISTIKNTFGPLDLREALNALIAAHNERAMAEASVPVRPEGFAFVPASPAEKLRRDPEGADEADLMDRGTTGGMATDGESEELPLSGEADLHEWSPQFQEQMAEQRRRRIESHE